MGGKAGKYSVYDSKTEMPLIIYATAKECAKAMGITAESFRRYRCRIRDGIGVKKWLIFRDDVEDDNDEYIEECIL